MTFIEPITFGLQTYVSSGKDPREINTGKGSFIVVDKFSKSSIKLQNPGVIYSDRFLEEISAIMQNAGSPVEVNCGKDSFSSRFIASELTSGRILVRIQNIDLERIDDWDKQKHLQRITAEIITRREQKGFFDFLRKKNVFVKFNQVENDNLDNIAEIEFPPGIDLEQDPGNDFDSDVSLKDGSSSQEKNIFAGNKYLNAPFILAEEPVLKYIDNIEFLLNEKGIVEIQQRDFLGNVNQFGLYIEKGENYNEVIINLNGHDEGYFGDVFIDLVPYFLKEGKTVVVDWDIEDRFKVENDVLNSEIYNSISHQIVVDIRVEERLINSYFKRTYVVLEPNSV